MKKVLLSSRRNVKGRYTFVSRIEDDYVMPQNTAEVEFVQGTIDNKIVEGVEIDDLVITLPHTDEVLVYESGYDFVEL
jgi:hypothetical protein